MFFNFVRSNLSFGCFPHLFLFISFSFCSNLRFTFIYVFFLAFFFLAFFYYFFCHRNPTSNIKKDITFEIIIPLGVAVNFIFRFELVKILSDSYIISLKRIVIFFRPKLNWSIILPKIYSEPPFVLINTQQSLANSFVIRILSY
jgi:hypothetical protein